LKPFSVLIVSVSYLAAWVWEGFFPGGPIADFSRGSQKDFSRRMLKVVKFHFSHSKQKNNFFVEHLQKIVKFPNPGKTKASFSPIRAPMLSKLLLFLRTTKPLLWL